jgi:hypothetical protein
MLKSRNIGIGSKIFFFYHKEIVATNLISKKATLYGESDSPEKSLGTHLRSLLPPECSERERP